MTSQIKLSTAERALLSDLCDVPVLRSEADYRRPFWSLQSKGLVRHNATVGSVKRSYWAPTSAGRELIEG